MADHIIENSNVQVYENSEMVYKTLKRKTISKLDILGNRIEKLMNIDEDILKNEESILLLLLESVKNIYTELYILKKDIENLKNYNIEECNM